MTLERDGVLGVVQFIHPGAEHIVDKTGWTAWNTKSHRRKYLLSTGTSVTSAGDEKSSHHLFWGEWEGPSRRVWSWDLDEKGLPRNLVVPEFPGSAMQVDGLQNTDPYVFGDAFKYTLCKQANRKGQKTFLTRLSPGTLVLFGSSLEGHFILDTALVVSDSVKRHDHNTWQSVFDNCSDVYRSMTLEPMYWDKNVKPGTTFTYYEGASHKAPFNEMFSFVPCVQETDLPQRFARPKIEFPGVINQSLMMGQKATPMGIESIRECWLSIVSQVERNDLRLGVRFEEPTKVEVPNHVWPH